MARLIEFSGTATVTKQSTSFAGELEALLNDEDVQMLNNWFVTPPDPGSTGSVKAGRSMLSSGRGANEKCRRGREIRAASAPAGLVVPARYWQLAHRPL